MARSVVNDVAAAAETSSGALGGATAEFPSSTATTSALEKRARPSSSEKGVTSLLRRAPARVRSQLPEPVRFALVVTLSFAFNALGQSFLHFWTNGELTSIARRSESNLEIALFAAWRTYVPHPSSDALVRVPHCPFACLSALLPAHVLPASSSLAVFPGLERAGGAATSAPPSEDY